VFQEKHFQNVKLHGFIICYEYLQLFVDIKTRRFGFLVELWTYRLKVDASNNLSLILLLTFFYTLFLVNSVNFQRNGFPWLLWHGLFLFFFRLLWLYLFLVLALALAHKRLTLVGKLSLQFSLYLTSVLGLTD